MASLELNKTIQKIVKDDKKSIIRRRREVMEHLDKVSIQGDTDAKEIWCIMVTMDLVDIVLNGGFVLEEEEDMVDGGLRLFTRFLARKVAKSSRDSLNELRTKMFSVKTRSEASARALVNLSPPPERPCTPSNRFVHRQPSRALLDHSLVLSSSRLSTASTAGPPRPHSRCAPRSDRGALPRAPLTPRVDARSLATGSSRRVALDPPSSCLRPPSTRSTRSNSTRKVSVPVGRSHRRVQGLANTGVGTAHVPKEDLAVKHVLEALKPYRVESGGVLEVEHVSSRGGTRERVIKYPGKGPNASAERQLTFAGSHMDVVPANPEAWSVDPFKLTMDGDKLYGRGTTDCLGHVALMTTIFAQLGEMKPVLDTTLTCVFIASEEANGPGIGVDGLVANGKMDHCKAGPVIWVDSPDSQPCIGTAGAITWSLKAKGHRFHSGLPHKGINAIEMGMAAIERVQNKFTRRSQPANKKKIISSSRVRR